MKNILLIGPLPDPITGLSIANQTVLDSVDKYCSDYKVNHINTGYHVLERPGSFSFEKLFFYSKCYLQLFKVFSNDYIYITLGQTFFGVMKYAPFVFLAKLLKKQILVHIHGNHLHTEYKDSSKWKKKLMHMVLSKVDKGIVLSESLVQNMSPFISDKNIYPLYNFVEDGLIDSSDFLQSDFDSLRILYLSNLMESKGIFDLLDAACVLKEKNIIFSLEVAGKLDEENRERFEGYQTRLGNSLNYLGIVKGDTKKQAFLRSNVFVFPSYLTEGQPISILEAMATGNVVLTADHAGVRDIFKEGVNGYYIDKQSSGSIAKKMIELSKNLAKQKAITQNNRKIAVEKYTVEKFIKNLIDIIEK